MKKYQDGGKTGAQLKKEGMAMKAAGKAMKAKGAVMKYDANKSKRESYMLQSGADDRAGNITQSMKTGGATKKYQNGGPVEAMYKAMGKKEPSLKKTLKYVKKNGSGYIPSNNSSTQRPNTDSYKSAGTSIKTAKRPNTKYQDGGRTISEKAAARKVAKGKGTISKSYPSGPEEKGSYVGYSKEARKSDGPWKSMKDSKPARPIMKTGGMVNSNAKIAADKTPGSKGVKSGVNPKAAASKVAKGKVGGMSTAPKTAVPKAKYGMSMRRK
jgi:hypothetical protein